MRSEKIMIGQLTPPAHPARTAWDEGYVHELAMSIRRIGVIEPLIVKKVSTGYEVVAGHMRLLAATEAQIAAVPCHIIEDGDAPEEAIKLHENLWRQDLSPVDEAMYFQELFDKNGEDTDRVAELVRHNRAYVEKRLNLLTLDAEILRALALKQISQAVGEELRLVKSKKNRLYLLSWAIRQGATAWQVADWARTYNQMPDPETGDSPPRATPRETEKIEEFVPVCWICKSSARQERMRMFYAHDFCVEYADVQSLEAARKQEQVEGQA